MEAVKAGGMQMRGKRWQVGWQGYLWVAVVGWILLLTLSARAYAQQPSRIAVLPLQNLHGLIDYNALCYEFADSLAKALRKQSSRQFTVIHPDTVDLAVLQVNLNPDNPQFLSDRWIVAAKLGADKVVTGTLNVRYGKVFINIAVYDIRTKRAEFQLRNLYRSQKQYLQLVNQVAQKVGQYLSQKQ